jgi:hypothetical protein
VFVSNELQCLYKLLYLYIQLDYWKVPRHPSFLLTIKITILDIFYISLPLSLSLSPFLSLSLSLFISLSDQWRGCVHPCEHKACPHSKRFSFSQSACVIIILMTMLQTCTSISLSFFATVVGFEPTILWCRVERSTTVHSPRVRNVFRE